MHVFVTGASGFIGRALVAVPADTILHAIAEEAVPVRQIAEALADRLGVPAKSAPAEQIADEIPFIGGSGGSIKERTMVSDRSTKRGNDR